MWAVRQKTEVKMDEMSAGQNADLNQSSGIFDEGEKGIFSQIGEKLGGFFKGLAKALGKIFVEKKPIETDENSGRIERLDEHEEHNIEREPANSTSATDTSFVGPMNRNIFADKDTAAKLVRHEAKMDEINEMGNGMSGTGANIEMDNGSLLAKNLPAENLPEIFYPETTEDLVWLINKLPEEVISKQQRRTMAAAMTFDSKIVKEVMTPKNEVIIIHENDFMGPLTLSRLYQSGLSHFPVVGARGEIVGLIHTKTLFSLSVKETDRASAFLDKNVYYMSENYTLKEALLAFIRTSCYFFIVVDDHGKVTGLMSFHKLIEMIVGNLPETDFDQDQDLMSVVKYARTLQGSK